MGDSRISPYSLNDLKNTTDDALGNYLRGLNFKQDNSKLDVRLALGYVGVVVAGATFVADFKLGWEATKWWTAVAVAAYAVLNGALTYWMFFVERGLIFEGVRNGNKVAVYSKTKKHEPTYYLEVHTTKPGSTPSIRELRVPFTTWFTADGWFVAKPLQQWLASSIDAIGDADPKNASRDERDTLASPTPKVFPIQPNGANGVAAATGSDAQAKGSQRKSKKKA